MDGVRRKTSENIQELEPQQLAFVEAYSTPPYPSIAKAAEAVGYSPTYAYKLAQLPHVKAAIAERTAAIREANDSTNVRLVQKLGESALNGEGKESREDARLFFQGLNVGMGGVRIVNNVTANSNADALEDRINRLNSANFNPKDS